MLELWPNCKRRDKDLPPDAEARICTYECIFCPECVENTLKGVCPDCGGNFEKRPVSPAALLQKNPASTKRVLWVQE